MQVVQPPIMKVQTVARVVMTPQVFRHYVKSLQQAVDCIDRFANASTLPTAPGPSAAPNA